jgi:flavodoxin
VKTLVVYYSRTGSTQRVAEALAKNLKADMEEIVDLAPRSGAAGWLRGGRDATLKRCTPIQDLKILPDDYELVVIGTPVWAFNVTPAIRTFLHEYGSRCQRVAFFCVMGGSGDSRTFRTMTDLAGKQPLATLAMLEAQTQAIWFSEPLKKFADKLFHAHVTAPTLADGHQDQIKGRQ